MAKIPFFFFSTFKESVVNALGTFLFATGLWAVIVIVLAYVPSLVVGGLMFGLEAQDYAARVGIIALAISMVMFWLGLRADYRNDLMYGYFLFFGWVGGAAASILGLLLSLFVKTPPQDMATMVGIIAFCVATIAATHSLTQKK